MKRTDDATNERHYVLLNSFLETLFITTKHNIARRLIKVTCDDLCVDMVDNKSEMDKTSSSTILSPYLLPRKIKRIVRCTQTISRGDFPPLN